MLPFRSVKNFYPRPPRGGRPPAVARGYPSAKISIHALREEGDAGPQLRERPERISIHALREEGDEEGPKVFRLKTNFYPRPPRGGRPLTVRLSALPRSFLSTPSARRATRSAATRRRRCSNFYPRPPRGGRLSPSCVYALHWKFLSTPSARRATKAIDDYTMQLIISIHALREEGDTVSGYTKAQVLKFLSTPSARRATCMRQEQNSSICISIHALREEGDPTTPVTVRCMFLFLSTPSARRATMSGQGSFVPTEDFYPRPPRGGRRLLICAADLGGHISIHALREEGDEKAQD